MYTQSLLAHAQAGPPVLEHQEGQEPDPEGTAGEDEGQMMELKDSGSRQSFESGAVRDIQQGKGRFDLIPFEGLEAIAQVFEAGAVKYGERNWERGIPVSRYIDSMVRHAVKAANGMMDEPHLAQAAWNALCAITTIARYPDLDDRPYMLGIRPEDKENCRLYENAAVECETCPDGSCNIYLGKR